MSLAKPPKTSVKTLKSAIKATKPSAKTAKNSVKLSKSVGKAKDSTDYDDRIHAEMLDSFDEELEMEIDDDRMNELVGEATQSGTQHDLDRSFYFKELFRLQGELVKLQEFIRRHAELTNSPRAREVLANWDTTLNKFVKVMPKDYKRVLESIAEAKADGLTGEEAVNAAFEANSRDTSRVGGN